MSSVNFPAGLSWWLSGKESPCQCRRRRSDPLEKEMATHSSILAWRIPWTEEPGRLQSMGSQQSDLILQLNHHHQSTYL